MASESSAHVIVAALIKRAATLEADLTSDKVSALQLLLIRARREAIDAAHQLIFDCPPGDREMVTALQNEVRRFVDLVEFSREILIEAEQAERDLNSEAASEEDREIVKSLVMASPHALQTDDDNMEPE